MININELTGGIFILLAVILIFLGFRYLLKQRTNNKAEIKEFGYYFRQFENRKSRTF